MNILKLLSGYKTYVMAFSIVVAGINMISAGDWQGGILHILQTQEMVVIFAGLGLGSLRAGVEKLIKVFDKEREQIDNSLSFDDYLFTDAEGKPVSKAQFNKVLKEKGGYPVLGIKA